MHLSPRSFRCHRQGRGRPRLQVVLRVVMVGWWMVQVVVVRRESWVEQCCDGSRRGSDCCPIRPRCHQHQVWGCRPDWMGVQLVVRRLRGLWNDDERFLNVVWGEIDDVEEPRESGVLAVIVVCMEKEFCGPCRVSWKTEIEEGENEVEQHGEENVDDDVVVQKVDESVIVEPWIVVCALAMLEHVGGEEEKWLGQVGCDGQELQVRWVVLWVQVGAWP